MSDLRHPSPTKIEIGMQASYPVVEILAQCGKSKSETSLQISAALKDPASMMQATLALPINLLTTVMGAYVYGRDLHFLVCSPILGCSRKLSSRVLNGIGNMGLRNFWPKLTLHAPGTGCYLD